MSSKYQDKGQEYYNNRIRKEQLTYLIRPVIYALLVAVPEGMTTEDITYILNNTLGIRQYKLTFKKINGIIKSYKRSPAQSVFIPQGDKWLIRDMVGGYTV